MLRRNTTDRDLLEAQLLLMTLGHTTANNSYSVSCSGLWLLEKSAIFHDRIYLIMLTLTLHTFFLQCFLILCLFL